MILFVWTLLFFLQRVGVGVGQIHDGCISEKFCTCSEDKEDEICSDDTQTETLEVGVLYSQSLTNLTIRGFRWVNINAHALHQANPKTLKLTNIANLHIKKFAILSTQVSDLEISDIGNLELDEYSISLPSNAILLMKNVTTKYVKSYAIRGSNVTFGATDCDLGVMYSNAVYAYGIRLVFMRNTHITSMDRDAFNLTGLESTDSSVLFANVSFGKISLNSFVFDNLSEVVFESCDFGMISSSFVSGKGINAFRFVRNTVKSSDQGLFDELEAATVDLKKNDFVDLYDMSLPLQTVRQGWAIDDNVFRCNCDTRWLLKSSPDVLKRNWCLIDGQGSTEMVSLSHMEPGGENDPGSKCFRIKGDSSGTRPPDKNLSTVLFVVVFVMSAMS